MLKNRLYGLETVIVKRSVAREKGQRVCLSIHSGLFCFPDFKKIAFLFFGLILFINAAQSAAFAAPTPTISLNAPASASGIVTVIIDYSFPDDNGILYVEISGREARPLDTFIFGGSSGSWPLTLDTTFWPDGAYTIKAVASYVNITGSSVFVSQNITTTNTPRVSIASPSGEVRGIAEFNIPYRFPSAYTYGLFWFYLDSVEFQTVQIPLSSASTTEGNLQFGYDTTNWGDGQHKIKVVAKIGQCHTCSDIRPPTAIQEVNLTTNNAPTVRIISPSGRVKGIVNASLSYDFPATYYSQPALISLERQTIFGTYLTIASKSISLDSTQPTSGIWNFTFDVSNWIDGDYTLRAKAAYRKSNYDYMLITVANRAPTIPKTKEPPIEKTTQVGEPINVANGNMFTSAADISIPHPQISLELSRTYNSHDDFDGSFGYGWRSNFDIALSEQPDNSVIEVDEKGVYTVYTKNPDGAYSASAGKYSLLTKNPDNTYQILRKHGSKLYFNSSGLLTKIEDRNANYLAISRDSNGIIQEVSDSSARKLLFTANAQGKIIQVTDPAARVFKYEYDSNGNLIKTIDPLNKQTLYSYDSNHNLTQKTDANNHSLYFEYDSSDRAYHSWQDNHNNEVTLVFDPTNQATTTTDSLGNTTKYDYNDYGLVTKITDAQANTQSFIWDDSLNKTSSTNQNGATTTFTFDTRGNLLTITDPLNSITAFTYEPNFDFLSSKTDALGNRSEYSYDANGNLIQTKDSLNNITNYTYSQGLLTQLQDANNNITGFSYDSYSNLAQITDSQNNKTLLTYDIIGNKTQTTDAQNNLTSFSYDLLNRLTQITYADNSKVTYGYDPVGNLISSTDQNNNTTAYAYDAQDRLIQVTDTQGNATTYAFDTEGNRTSITDAAGNTTQYSYDSLNRLVKTQDPLGNQTQFSYDALGNNTQVIDAKSNTTSYEFDALNRLIKATDANNNITQYAYDKVGNRLSITDAKANITNYVYDGLNRLTKTIFPDSSFETYSYDPLSNLTQKVTRKGDYLNFSYDSLNRLTAKSYPDSSRINYTYDSLSRLITLTDSSGAITHAYDSLGRLTSVKYPNNMVVSYQYDTAGNRTKLTYPDATSITYTYDSLNRLTTIKDQLAATIAAFSYDNLSRRTNLTLANGVTTTYTYDQDSRLLSLSNQKGLSNISSFSYSYDQVGNRLSMLNKQGSYNYTYDNIDQLIHVQKPSLAQAAYSFDPLGNRTELINTSTQAYASNNLNQYTQITNGPLTTNLAYDLNGNLLSKIGTRQSGRVITKATSTFSYDFENRLSKVARGRLTSTFSYDAFGRRTSKQVNKTSPHKYIYDADNIILDLDSSNKIIAKYIYGPDTDEPLVMIKAAKKYYYSKDGLGSVVNLTNSSGKIAESYTYDEYGKPLNSSSVGNRYFFTGREYDRETDLYYYRARYYDPAIGRFLTQDPIGYTGGINLYSYCSNDPINYRDPYGLWVAIGEKSVRGVGSHTVIILHPDNEAEFVNDPRFYRNSKGELEATLSANPDQRFNEQSPFGNLVTTPNIRGDRPENMRNMQRIVDSLKHSDSRLINDIFTSANKYKNNLPYDPTPWPFDPYYNSNSYTYGVLKDAGISKPPNLPWWQPGADKPIPLNLKCKK